MAAPSEPMLALPSGERPRPKNLAPVGVALAGAGAIVGFGALMAAYVNLRHFNQPWPPRGVRLVNYPATMLVITALMGVATAEWGTWAARRELRGQAAAGFGFTIGFSLAFVNMLWFFGKGLKIGAASSPFATLIYAVLALGGVLALLGAGSQAAVLARVLARMDRDLNLAAARAATLYWEFFFVSWLLVTQFVYRPVAF